MERRQPELADRHPVLQGRVALVVLPAVPRVASRQQLHHPVADDLGDDRGAGDRVDLGITVDDVRVRPDVCLEPGDPVAVDEDVVVAPTRAIARRIARCVA